MRLLETRQIFLRSPRILFCNWGNNSHDWLLMAGCVVKKVLLHFNILTRKMLRKIVMPFGNVKQFSLDCLLPVSNFWSLHLGVYNVDDFFRKLSISRILRSSEWANWQQKRNLISLIATLSFPWKVFYISRAPFACSTSIWQTFKIVNLVRNGESGMVLKLLPWTRAKS